MKRIMIILNAIIIDDELYGIMNLSSLLKEYYPEIEVAGIVSSASDRNASIYEKTHNAFFQCNYIPKLFMLNLSC